MQARKAGFTKELARFLRLDRKICRAAIFEQNWSSLFIKN